MLDYITRLFPMENRDQKDLYTYLKTPYTNEDSREALYRAATLAQDLGWTFMEASFQLGEKAKDDGLDTVTVEATIRRAFSRERRTRDRKTDGNEPVASPAASLEFDSESIELLERRRIDPDALSIPWPSDDWRKDLHKLLDVAFKPNESVDIKVSNTPKVQREKISNILAQAENVNKIMRTLDGDDGALISINPSACESPTDDTWRFRHVVVDSPRMSLAKQLAFYKALNLPCSALVNSGANSVQAWVKIEASDANEFTDRVDFLYQVLDEHGFKTDHTNKTPSMMVRMPGVLRQGKQQYLIGLQQGARTWKEWQEWVEHNLDGNPLLEQASYHTSPPQPEAELIEGVLRTGQFLLLSAPPRSGKSFALIDLALALCHGKGWLGFHTFQSDVLYVNMELTKPTFLNRIHLMAGHRGLKADTPHLGFLNLRGGNMAPRELATFIAKRINGARKYENRNYRVVIIDPLMAIVHDGGDRITACNPAFLLQQMVDLIASNSGSAVVGAITSEQAQKLGMLPDGQLDLIPIAERPGIFQLRGTFREFPAQIGRECSWRFPAFS